MSAKSFAIAVVAFLLYSGLAIGGGWWLLHQEDIGKETTTETKVEASTPAPTREPAAKTGTPTMQGTAAPPGAIGSPTPTAQLGPVTVARTTTEKQSSAVIIVLGLLTAGGWVLIPLKFAWDELGKETASAREEREDKADDRRKTAEKMRETLYPALTEHFGPLLYCQSSVLRWAERALDLKEEKRKAASLRLLYAAAVLEERYKRLQDKGLPLILRSTSAEEKAVTLHKDLRSCVYEYCGAVENYDEELVRAVRTGADEGDAVVPFSTFRKRAKEERPGWPELAQMAGAFETACGDSKKLERLTKSAKASAGALADGLTEIYREWYDPKRKSAWRFITGPIRWYFTPTPPLFPRIVRFWRLWRQSRQGRGSREPGQSA